MNLRLLPAFFAFLALGAVLGGCRSAPGTPTGFADPRSWAVEQVQGGRVVFAGDQIEIMDQGGCTLWWRQELTEPVEISYSVTPILGTAAGVRVSDVNCFWMARESRSTAAPFESSNARSGRFADYNDLLTYYVGVGGNNNTTTRFRRYDGSGARPLLPEHDLSEARFLLQPNQPLEIRIVVREGVTEFWRNGERLFRYTDSLPLRDGWFAIRTVRSHLKIEHFSCRPLGR